MYHEIWIEEEALLENISTRTLMAELESRDDYEGRVVKWDKDRIHKLQYISHKLRFVYQDDIVANYLDDIIMEYR